MRQRFLQLSSAAIIAILPACALNEAGAQSGGRANTTTVSFASEAELDAFAEDMAKLERRMARRGQDYAQDIVVTGAAPLPAPPAAAEAAADAAGIAPENESITNNQEAGVDEGGIVKHAGDYLLVLRRGRLFTVRVGDDALAPVDAINAFPPGARNPGNTWYDELLVRGDQVIVIGYSYGDYGTEVNRFRLAADGQLTYRDTHYLKSADYYSSSNYASRLIGDELIFYAPLPMQWSNWRESLPTLRRRGAGGDLGEAQVLARPQDIHVARAHRRARMAPETLHVVTRCNLAGRDMRCEADAVAGSWGRVFYVSQSAVYVWTEDYRPWYSPREGTSLPGQLFRIPLNGDDPGAVGVAGGPIDQFSFAEDRADGVLRVVLRGEARGEAMWASEFSRGELGLLSVPLAAFASGDGSLPRRALRELPAVEEGQLHNRFVGRHLLYASGDSWGRRSKNELFAVPLDGGEVARLELPHAVGRLDVLGRDGVAIGSDARGGLGFTAVALGRSPRVESTFRLPGASEGESRSQAFFYRPDPGSDGDSGTLGLPVSRQLLRHGGVDRGSSAAIQFLRRENRALAPAGELAAGDGGGRDDNCIASCVDWYGNARPIFLGGRVFALMGYELVEGTLSGGRIGERRRVDFSPGRTIRH